MYVQHVMIDRTCRQITEAHISGMTHALCVKWLITVPPDSFLCVPWHDTFRRTKMPTWTRVITSIATNSGSLPFLFPSPSLALSLSLSLCPNHTVFHFSLSHIFSFRVSLVREGARARSVSAQLSFAGSLTHAPTHWYIFFAFTHNFWHDSLVSVVFDSRLYMHKPCLTRLSHVSLSNAQRPRNCLNHVLYACKFVSKCALVVPHIWGGYDE